MEFCRQSPSSCESSTSRVSFGTSSLCVKQSRPGTWSSCSAEKRMSLQATLSTRIQFDEATAACRRHHRLEILLRGGKSRPFGGELRNLSLQRKLRLLLPLLHPKRNKRNNPMRGGRRRRTKARTTGTCCRLLQPEIRLESMESMAIERISGTKTTEGSLDR